MQSRFRTPHLLFTLLLAVSTAPFASAQKIASAPHAKPPNMAMAAPAPLLPESFAGFELEGKLDRSTEPGTVDPANAQVLVEYGFRDFATGTYKNNVNSVTLRAIRFGDASGAYGAYTFYRIPGMHPEDIGKSAAVNGSRVIFWNGATVVDAKFDHLTAMSAAELRELADKLPMIGGAAGVPPALPGFLPRQDLEPTHTRYSLGPQAYTQSGGVLPASLIDFSKSPEVLSGGFDLPSGEGILTLIEYPTPQIAAERERAIAAYLKGGSSSQPPFPEALTASNTQALSAKRSGLLVAVTSGAIDATDARKLLDRIHYEASVTWNNPAGYVPETTKAAKLLSNIIIFCLITCGATFLLGIFLGGGRALYRVMRGKPASTVEEMEFIKLDLH